ncbi:uncharacterized protein J3D65DRAFT_667559 [Phyllosticta citribraziliensis]|uniref:BTB domain-containing protein n=1 Tax=Phyllosticta citribraziliensis TaxID=989973 RepID=A0ABR1LNS7_9PEZI
MANRPVLPVLQAQGNLYDYLANGSHSDFRIRDRDGSEWLVHKIILCLQSEYFERMLNPARNYTELRNGVVELKDEPPNVIEAVVNYFYRLDYSDEDMDDDHSKLLFHILVYAAGETFRVPGLKDAAKQHFIDALHPLSFDEINFPRLVQEIYASTVHSDRGLRDVVVQLTRDRIDEARNTEGFEDELEDITQFFRDLSDSSTSELHQLKSLPRYTCRWCTATMFVDFPLEEDDEFYCPICGEIQDSEMWQAYRVTSTLHAPLKDQDD